MLPVVMVTGIALILSACAASDAKQFSMGSQSLLATEADVRATMVNQRGMFCSEPPPDVANDTSKTLAAQLGAQVGTTGSGSGSVNSQSIRDIVSLTVRPPTFDGIRQNGYRLCEAYANQGITEADYARGLLLNTAILGMLVGMEECRVLYSSTTAPTPPAADTCVEKVLATVGSMTATGRQGGP